MLSFYRLTGSLEYASIFSVSTLRHDERDFFLNEAKDEKQNPAELEPDQFVYGSRHFDPIIMFHNYT